MEEKACIIFFPQQNKRKAIRNSRKNYNSEKVWYKYEREQKQYIFRNPLGFLKK